jgi:hypothetical protein
VKARRWFGDGLAVAGGLALAAAGLAGCGSPEDSFGLGTHRAGLVLGSARWQQPLSSLPPSRMGHALIYDSARAVTLAVGGRPVSDTGSSSADTWAWDGSVWTELPASFPARGFIQGTFDSARQVSVIYGGIDQSPMSAYFAETQERSADTWSNRSGTPGARSSSGLAYDAGRGVTVLFGGFDGAWRNDIWEWNGTAWTQGCTASPCNTSMPSRRAGMVLSYDAARQQTLLFGGFDSSDSDIYLGDTWTWDGSVWTQHTPPSAPSARVSAAAAYDPVTQLVYLYGGAGGGGELGDLWVWDGSTWQQVEASGAPGPRRDAKLAWDGARRRGVLYGGRNGSQSVDFWELSLVDNECTTSTTCHTGVCDGTRCLDPDAPDVDAGASDDAGSAAGGGAAGAAGAGGAAGTGGSTGGMNASGGSGGTTADAGVAGTGVAAPPVQRARGEKSLYACAMSPSERAGAGRRGGALGVALLAAAAWLGRRRTRR